MNEFTLILTRPLLVSVFRNSTPIRIAFQFCFFDAVSVCVGRAKGLRKFAWKSGYDRDAGWMFIGCGLILGLSNRWSQSSTWINFDEYRQRKVPHG